MSNKPIQIYLTDAQHHALKRQAFNRRVSLSDYVREQLGLPHVQQGKRSAGKAGGKSE